MAGSRLPGPIGLHSSAPRWLDGVLGGSELPGPIGLRHQTIIPVAVRSAEPVIAWGAKVSTEFKGRVLQIADELKIDPSYLMAAMAFETGESFSPSIRNAAGSGAVGLIQFMPNTAKALGTSSDELAGMTAVKQLDYVLKYFSSYKGKLQSLADVYMTILWPRAVGKSDAHVLFDKNNVKNPKLYSQNKGVDLDRDGLVTKDEAATKVHQKLLKGMERHNAG